MKTLREFIEEAKEIAPIVEAIEDPQDEAEDEAEEELEAEPVNEAADIELKPHENGTHYTVHKIHPNSGIKSDQLKTGEKISDTHVDDLHDMGYRVKVHKK